VTENSVGKDALGALALARAPTLTGRVAIITGGAGGIGAAVATRLAALGAAVVVNDLGADASGAGFNADAANQTAGRIRAFGGRAVAYHSSVADPGACELLVRQVLKKLGRLDILVNAAGNIRRGFLVECQQDDWGSVLAVHLGGHMNMIGPALEAMRAGGGGQIVNVTSSSGLLHMPPQSVAYATAKRAVAALTWHLGRHSLPGVSVKAIAPVANTRMTSPAAQKLVEEANSRMAGPEDIAPLFSALSCPESADFNGAVLFTNGAEISQIQPPRCTEFVRAGVPPGVVWKACDQATRKNGTVTGNFIPRFLGSDEHGAPPTSGLAVAILAEEPLCQQLPDLFRAADVAATVFPFTRTATFDEAQSRLKASLDSRPSTDIFVIATCGPAREPEAYGSTTALQRLAGHASWTRAAQLLSQDQGKACSIWNVAACDRHASRGYEIMRDALSAFASIASAGPSVKSRGYSASLIDHSIPSAEALVAACLQFHLRDVENRLSGHAVVISDGGSGCWSKPEVVGTVSSPTGWSEQSVLTSLGLLLG
jgi:NAD(P)-dependent dehydrogenase (short-subunit alcohol dehydrogenase family)